MNSRQSKKYQQDLVRRRIIAYKKDLEGEEGVKLRKELLNLLNKQERIKATGVIDIFSKEKGMKCTRVMLPKKPPGFFGKMEYVLVVFLNDINLNFTYSGLISPKWKNRW